ncbi:MAG: inositol 2-dehydrogenase [Desertimonas sp.]
MSTLTIGLLGAGRIGKVHASAIAATADARLVAVADAFAEPAEALAREHGAEVRSVDAIVDATDIDAIFITSPTDVHAEMIEAGARAGKKVFCEKPIDLDVERVRAVLEVVEQHDALLMVGFNRRFDPNFMTLRARITAGDIGAVEMVNIVSRDPSPPPLEYMERSGGLFKDMTIHDFDMARFMLGEEPVAVAAFGSALINPLIVGPIGVDSAAISLLTDSGKIAQISNSRRATYGYDQRIEVHGSAGMARAQNLHEDTVEIAGSGGYTTAPLMNFFIERYMPAYRAEVATFVAAALHGGSVSPTGSDGLQALIIAEAATRSHLEGRIVELSEI